MKNKHLTGAYPGGYALSASYTGLVIQSSALVGGGGVSAAFTATIANFGVVSAAGANYGVNLAYGGTVTNGSATNKTALIAGYGGVIARSGPATITNFGMIRGVGLYTYNADGVLLDAGGMVTNGSAADTAALIIGYNFGLVAQGAAVVTVDLLKIAATAASINAKDQLVIVNGTTTVATLQLSGPYSGATFTVGLDTHGGTNITLFTAASVTPPAALVSAMAGLGASARSAVVTAASSAHQETWRPMLLGPRAQRV